MNKITVFVFQLFVVFSLDSFALSGNELAVNRDPSIHSRFYHKVSNFGISYESFMYGFAGYKRICDSLGICYRYLCIADFEKPSSEKRLYVIDMQDSSLFHIDYVSHGRNSGELYAENFSNDIHSYQSSLGFYLISETYDGKHGLSIRLDGLDKGFNDRARQRAIVMHSADYAQPSFIDATGRLGRSLGCPALPSEGFSKLAPVIKDNSVLFIYFPQKEYLTQSVWLRDQLIDKEKLEIIQVENY
ncbi:MAG: murein L,D-transpeptidase catalytic domain family protein [Cytophagales bacterium]